jgi:hypothetical protein
VASYKWSIAASSSILIKRTHGSSYDISLREVFKLKNITVRCIKNGRGKGVLSQK